MTAVIPLDRTGQTFYVPAFELKVNGRPAARGVVRDLTEITYEDSLDAIDSFTLTFNNWDTDHLRPQFVGEAADEDNWAVVQPGNGIELRMGYQGDLRLMTTGYITALEADFPETGWSKLTVRGLNILDRLRDKQYTWSWPATGNERVKDSTIAEDLGQAPNSPEGHPGITGITRIVTNKAAKDLEKTYEHVFMNNQYPIVFLIQLARRNGYEVVYQLVDEQPQLYFGPSRELRDVVYKLEWGKTLTALKANVSAARQVKKLTVLGWDRAQKKPIRGEATIDDTDVVLPDTVRALARATGREEVVTDHVVSTQEQARHKAVNLLIRNASRLVEVEGSVIGLPDLRAGRNLELDRVGPHLRGTYLLTWTRHVINDSGYRTQFKARMEGRQG
jgi:phage protein D